MTLIEVIVGLVVGVALLVVCRTILDTVRKGTRDIETLTYHTTRWHNGLNLIRSAIASVDNQMPSQTAEYSGPALRGDTTRMTLQSRCTVGAGWREPCAVTLWIRSTPGPDGQDLRELTISTPVDGALTVIRTPETMEFLYLISPRVGGHWSAVWHDRSTLPMAIGIRTGDDTLVFRTGQRE